MATGDEAAVDGAAVKYRRRRQKAHAVALCRAGRRGHFTVHADRADVGEPVSMVQDPGPKPVMTASATSMPTPVSTPIRKLP